MQEEFQTTVEDTNQQAMASKISAMRRGYFKDSFAEEFSCFKGKRDIIMHRGYWARVYIVRRLVEDIIKNGDNVQVVSLGCGLETLWFNLAEEELTKKPFTFVELDLKSVVKKKIKKIQGSKKITSLFQSGGQSVSVNEEDSILTYGNQYKLAPCDLSSLQQFENIIQKLAIDPKKPTLFYCECVLSYVDSEKVDDLLAFIHKKFPFCFFFDYEMFNPNDRFGSMMVKNFQRRGCPLIGISKYPELADQRTRFQKAGFARTQLHTMAQTYYECIPKEERVKVEKLEMLDQLEEWNLIMGHYFSLLSTNCPDATEPACMEALVKNVRLSKGE